MGVAAPDVTADRARVLAGVLLVALAAAGAAWALAYPQASPAAAGVRAVADGAAVASLGLAAVPALDSPRHRTELARRAAGPLAAVSAVWLLAEAVRLVVAAAQAAAVPVGRLPLWRAAEFAVSTTAGRSGLFSLAAATLVCLVTLTTSRTPAVGAATTGVAAAGLAARAVAGHLSESAVGAVAIAVHALAAAVWCGTLVALAVTVSHRGQWARVLPRFSQLALVCVVVLLAGGVTGALVTVDSVAELYRSGYGRVLLGKVVLTAVLLVLALRNRTRWVPVARAHQISAGESRSRSRIEIALMAAALTMAAALAVTG